ncbi:MAG: LysR family transcriptional regulator [Acidobacteriaceae bacterium]|nr:LysR family transcriptional regulator [Acidobacteriaceae bacterium]
MDIELRHLRYFVAVADELHFGRAARRLHLAQPPLSQQIRKLEEILGCQLFLRTSRAVRLTAAGEAFLERARRTLSNVQDDMQEARSIGRGEQGLLRVGFISSAMLTVVPRTFGTYRRRFPKVQLQLFESYTASVMRSLTSGEIDVGILRDGGPANGLHVEPLLSEPYVAVLPKRHPLAASNSISAAALRDEPFVFHAPSAGTRAFEKPMSIFEEHGFRPQIVQEAPQWLTLLRLVGAGLGVTVAPACVEKIVLNDVVCVRLRGVKARSDLELAYREGEHRAIVKGFAEILRSGVGRVKS